MWWRSILGVVAGYGVMTAAVVGSHQIFYPEQRSLPSVGAMVGLLIGDFVAAMLGGWVAGWVAGRAPLLHALVVAGVAVGMWVGYVLSGAAGEPLAYQLANLVALAGGPSLGGWLRQRQAGG